MTFYESVIYDTSEEELQGGKGEKPAVREGVGVLGCVVINSGRGVCVCVWGGGRQEYLLCPSFVRSNGAERAEGLVSLEMPESGTRGRKTEGNRLPLNPRRPFVPNSSFPGMKSVPLTRYGGARGLARRRARQL